MTSMGAGRAVTAMTAGLFATLALVCASPAYAEGVPNPEPVPAVPDPSASVQEGQGECQAGETRDAANGNCVPAMTPVGSEGADVPAAPAPTRGTGDVTSTTESGIGTELVPNINGDPCTGYWESTACLVPGAPAVRPESTLSSSP
ncbi:MAG: hypothetical protein KDB55_08120 [Mycobacterium sp.]|nr:hypothetical protein [Mycobacterium sp.]